MLKTSPPLTPPGSTCSGSLANSTVLMTLLALFILVIRLFVPAMVYYVGQKIIVPSFVS